MTESTLCQVNNHETFNRRQGSEHARGTPVENDSRAGRWVGRSMSGLLDGETGKTYAEHVPTRRKRDNSQQIVRGTSCNPVPNRRLCGLWFFGRALVVRLFWFGHHPIKSPPLKDVDLIHDSKLPG